MIRCGLLHIVKGRCTCLFAGHDSRTLVENAVSL